MHLENSPNLNSPTNSFRQAGDLAEVVFDNYQVNVFEALVAITIEKAVRLSFRDPGAPYIIEGAPGVDGPWTKLDGMILIEEDTGLHRITIPAPESSRMKVFRLVEMESP